MSKQVDKLLRLFQAGYLPYRGQVAPDVYDELRCPAPKRASWFAKGGRYLCLGCSRLCARADATGFDLLLPVPVKRRARACFAFLPQVSAEQLLSAKSLLRLDEVAWVLNISESEARNLRDEGALIVHPDPPLRFTSESVRMCLLHGKDWRGETA